MRSLPVVLAALFVFGCAKTASVPDPRDAALAWADAAEKGDADALYAMMTKRSRATMSKAEVTASVSNAKQELKDQAKDIREAKDHISTVAILRYEDGSQASLVLKGDRFFVKNAIHLPGGAATKEEAVAAFREALRKRSYPALLRLLSPALRAAIEAQLKGLEKALESPDALAIPKDASDEIEIKLENGHKLRLKRVDQTWYIDNFE